MDHDYGGRGKKEDIAREDDKCVRTLARKKGYKSSQFHSL